MALVDVLIRRGWTVTEDGGYEWRPAKRTRFMPERDERPVLVWDGGERIHAPETLAYVPLCYLGPAQDEMDAIASELTQKGQSR